MEIKKLKFTIDTTDKIFYTHVANRKAYIRYREARPDILDLRETFVPKVARNEGIASKLAKYALEYAKSKEYLIIPTCSFITDFLQKNEEYQFLIHKK
ncbi:GNAT family N-acetyltransferase [Aquimarina sp. M1]